MTGLTILHTEESGGWGGQEIRILAEMLGMKARGHRVLLAAPGHATIHARAKDAGVDVFTVRMNKSDLAGGALRLAGIIRRERVNVVNTHSSRDSWMGAIAGRLTGAKVVRTRHISSALNKSPFTRLVYGPLCDRVTTTGEFIKAQLVRELGLPPEKVIPVPTGIEIEKFANADGSRFRAELGLSDGAIVLGTAAALRSWKGHEFIIMALPEILKEFPGAVAVFAGQGPRRRFLEETARVHGVLDKVIFTGHREDVPEVVRAFDISILASYASEGIPQFVLQSMAAGKPVIGSAVGGIPEVVSDGVNGYVVPPKDAGAVAGAVIRLLREPGLMDRMGGEGHRIAAERHSFVKMLDDVEAVYTGLLSR